MSRSFEGHNVAYQCKRPDQSNIVCEYEVNRLTNETIIRGKRNFNANNNKRPPTHLPARPV